MTIGGLIMSLPKLEVSEVKLEVNKPDVGYVRELLGCPPCIIHIYSERCAFSPQSLEVADRIRSYYSFPIHSVVYQQDFRQAIPELIGSPSFVVVSQPEVYEVLTGNFRVPQLIALVNCILLKVDKDTGLSL